MESDVIGGHEGGDDVWRGRNKGVSEGTLWLQERRGRINTSVNQFIGREGRRVEREEWRERGGEKKSGEGRMERRGERRMERKGGEKGKEKEGGKEKSGEREREKGGEGGRE